MFLGSTVFSSHFPLCSVLKVHEDLFNRSFFIVFFLTLDILIKLIYYYKNMLLGCENYV